MRTAIIVIMIFSLLAISFTYTMIQINNQNKSAKIVTTNTKTQIISNNTPLEETRDNEEQYEKIVIGETKYFENPIDFVSVDVEGKEIVREPGRWYGEIIEMKDSPDRVKLKHSYYQISGLKNKKVEEKINLAIKEKVFKIINNAERYSYNMTKYNINGNFSNVVSLSIGEYLNFNLLTGDELSFQDCIYDKENIKAALSKRIRIALLETTAFSSYIIEDGNIGNYWYNYETDENMELSEQELNQINSFLDNSQIKLMNMFDNDEFEFYFDKDNLYITFYSPTVKKMTEELNNDIWIDIYASDSFVCKLPFYEILDNVIIFDKFSKNRDIFENVIAEDKFVCLSDFEKINDNFWYNGKPISDDTFEYLFERGTIEDYHKIEDKRLKILNDLKQKSDKKIVSLFLYLHSQVYGGFYINYTLQYDVNASQQEIKDVCKVMASYDEVVWDTQIYDRLISLSENLKHKYKDVDYSIERVIYDEY